jgi:NADP-reducing hydrogenase subunit HndB
MMTITKIRSLAELRKIKETASTSVRVRSKGKTRVLVRLGTCSVAARAHTVAQALAEEVRRRQLNNVVVVETKDCSRLCRGEPFIDIIQSDAPCVTYGHVEPSIAFRIVDEHLVNGQVLQDLVAPPEE